MTYRTEPVSTEGVPLFARAGLALILLPFFGPPLFLGVVWLSKLGVRR